MRSERSATADAHLGIVLALVAGAANAGGFLAVGQYTSHMSGVVSSLADNLALGDFELVAVGLSAFFAFVSGAATSAILINWGRRHHAESQYTLPLVIEAALLLVFGVVGGLRGHVPYFISFAIPLLCFIMGLQNAMITKVSQSRIRTTHLTGIVTDIGIECGKILYHRKPGDGLPPVVPDFKKLRLYLGLLGSFLSGALLGRWGSNISALSVPCPWLACCCSWPVCR